MTYNTTSYEFTAFAEADLLQGVNGGSIGCGDVFTMPSSPSTCFSVTDDDGSLSGDKYNNEAGDDSSYQTASIEVDGVVVETNAKIYAESYHVLHGSDGKTYYMIEIELKDGDAVGQGDDYFTFYGDVPPDGISLTVGNTCNVTSNWVDYKCLSAGEKDWVLDEECTYTLEAEDMNLSGYRAEYNDAASGDELIKLKQDVGYAKADFGGESGAYNVKISYVDENDGEGFIDVFVNGQFVGCIDLSENDNGNGVHNTTISSFVIEGVQIEQGDEIKLKGRKDGAEYARIDKIEFEQVKEPEFRECDDPDAVNIDFNDLASGDVVAAQFAAVGLTISAQREGDDPNSENDAMVFDSANPTGGDTDLATADQGNVLIVSEDNDSSDPDDNIGGTVVFDFDNPSFVFDIKVIDTEEGGTITLRDANGDVIATVEIPQIGDGDISQVLIDVDGVSSMQVVLNGSGAIDDLCFVPGEPQTEICLNVGDICVDENTDCVVDLGAFIKGEGNADVGLDACDVRDQNGFDKPAQLTLVYNPAATGVNTQGDKSDVTGGPDDDSEAFVVVLDKDDNVLFSGNLSAGDDFTFGPAPGDDKFDSETTIKIFDDEGGPLLQTIDLHTSCSVPLVIGESFGSIELSGFAFDDNGTLVEFGGPGNGAADEGITYAIVGGDDAAFFEVDAASGKVTFIDAPDFENPQDADQDNFYDVVVRATAEDGAFVEQALNVEIKDVDDDPLCVEENTTFVVDLDLSVECPGDDGLDACQVKSDNKFDKPVALTLTLGKELTDIIVSAQDAKKTDAELTGAVDDDSTVFIRVSRDSDANETEAKSIYFSDEVDLGDSFTALRDNAGRDFGGQTFVHIFDQENGTLLQTIEFHTSCSQPLVIGDQYGSVSLSGFAFVDDAGGLVEFGGTTFETEPNIIYSIEGGADADLFQVDATTGEVTFISAPDFETPQDAGGDNIYDVVVRATSINDSSKFVEEPLQIEVKDVSELGSLAGRYFCDTDGDDLDNNNGDEPGLNGLTVTLLNATGGVVATATTQNINGVDGSYLFENLEAGDYRVSFETDPDGKAFVAQTAGDNDSIGGSDVDPTNGETGVISLAAGEDKTDVDAGVVELGSISGRYFCDTDGDDLDNGNGSEPGLNNIRVTLFDVDGGIVATQFTSTIGGVDGAYFFGDLAAGDYRVEFAADPDGKVFVAKNNDIDNDAIGGSDADPLDGQTDVINLSVGENVIDVDAGVVEPNVDPEAEDAAGALCAVTDGVDALTFDLSALTSDSNAGDVLTFGNFVDAGDDNQLGTLDDQAFTLADGGSFTLSSGAQVSLAGDVLTYNLEGTGAYDDLLIGETALDVIGYEVADGNGGTANGQIDATVKGSLNTLETIEASLPSDPISFVVTDLALADPTNPNAFTLEITSSSDARLDGAIFEEAYCLARAEDLIVGETLEANVFLADEDSIPAGALDQQGAFDNVARENLDLVNWILNQDFGSQDNGDGTGETYTDAEIQGAVWGLMDNFIFISNLGVTGTIENSLEIALDAQANGEGFEAGENDIIGLFIDPTLATEQNPGHAQPFIIGVPFSDLQEDCLC